MNACCDVGRCLQRRGEQQAPALFNKMMVESVADELGGS